jgi:hypothetical protein
LEIEVSSASILSLVSPSLVELLPPHLRSDMTQKVQHFRVIDAERNIGVFVTMTEEESGCLSETFDAWDSAKRSQPVETVSRRSVMAVLRKLL